MRPDLKDLPHKESDSPPGTTRTARGSRGTTARRALLGASIDGGRWP